MNDPQPISTASSFRRRLAPTGNTGDAVFRVLLMASAVLLMVVVLLIAVMWWDSRLSIDAFGWVFLTNRD